MSAAASIHVLNYRASHEREAGQLSLFDAASDSGFLDALPDTLRDAPVFTLTPRYKFLSTRDGRGTEIRFCWSVVRNAGGAFLTWREHVTRTGVHRHYVRGHKRRKDARESAVRSMENFEAAR